jgi:hypothetical protein
MVEFLKVLTRRQLIRHTPDENSSRSNNNTNNNNEQNSNRLEKKLTLSSLIFLNVSNTIGSGILSFISFIKQNLFISEMHLNN